VDYRDGGYGERSPRERRPAVPWAADERAEDEPWHTGGRYPDRFREDGPPARGYQNRSSRDEPDPEESYRFTGGPVDPSRRSSSQHRASTWNDDEPVRQRRGARDRRREADDTGHWDRRADSTEWHLEAGGVVRRRPSDPQPTNYADDADDADDWQRDYANSWDRSRSSDRRADPTERRQGPGGVVRRRPSAPQPTGDADDWQRDYANSWDWSRSSDRRADPTERRPDPGDAVRRRPSDPPPSSNRGRQREPDDYTNSRQRQPADYTEDWQRQPSDYTGSWQRESTDYTGNWQRESTDYTGSWQRESTDYTGNWQREPLRSGTGETATWSGSDRGTDLATGRQPGGDGNSWSAENRTATRKQRAADPVGWGNGPETGRRSVVPGPDESWLGLEGTDLRSASVTPRDPRTDQDNGTFWSGTRLAGDDPRWVDTPTSAPRSPAVTFPNAPQSLSPPSETRRPRYEPPSQRRLTYRIDDELIDANPGGYLPSLLYTAGWYAVPVMIFLIWALSLNGAEAGCVADASGGGCVSERSQAIGSLLTATPQFAYALMISLVLTVLIRWVSGTWRAASVGLAASVIGGGMSTVLTSAITGQPIG